MSDILQQILATKREEIEVGSRIESISALAARMAEAPRLRGFRASVAGHHAQGEVSVIAEIKRASPSKGLIREDFDVARLAQDYQRGGAAALSVLTDQQYFQGHDDYIHVARAACDLPVLRKDFIIDPWQVYQTRLLGADCMLLIVAALPGNELYELASLATDCGLDLLVEVHDEEELQRALEIENAILGINNRNLRTFETHLETTESLMQRLPDGRLVVSESGIASHDDVTRLQSAGVAAFLVGESLMRQDDPGDALIALRGA